jgi:hypothetical protein
MKKSIYSFALMGFFALAAPKVATADDNPYANCQTKIMYCGDVLVGYVVVCDQEDEDTWAELLC